MTRLGSLLLLCCAIFAPLPSAMAQWTCVVVSPDSHAYAAAGGQQGGYTNRSGSHRAAIWSGSPGSLVSLHQWNSEVFGMSPTTQVGNIVAGSQHAALWFGTAASLVDLNPPGAYSSAAYATNGAMHVGFVNIGNPPTATHAAAWFGSSPAFTDLNPSNATGSLAFGISGTRIVGYIFFGSVSFSHAGVWSGSASTFVDLHPAVASRSVAFGGSTGQQVGYAVVSGLAHASVWSGTAASWIDLHPGSPVVSSIATAAFGGRQVGYLYAGGGSPRAALWNGSAASWVDLQSFVPAGFIGSSAEAIWDDGTNLYVAGWGTTGGTDSALLWTTPSTPSTSAINTTVGQGCQQLTLTANTRPVLGTSWDLTVSSLPPNTVYVASFLGLSDPEVLDLASFGMPGCQLRASFEYGAGPWVPAGTTQNYSVAIPGGVPSLVGLQAFTQAIAFTSPPLNFFGAITSNGIMGTLGDL